MTPHERDIRSFESATAFEAWLADEHERSDGIWLCFAKKGSGIASVTYAEAVDLALCYGWIDGQAKSLDESRYLQRFTPRRARSKWSKINCDKVERLVREGRMKPRGLAEVERAKADGRWDAAYDSPKTATVPDDLAAALAQSPQAEARFATLDSTNRYAMLYGLQDAKRPETRARRIAKYVAMLEAGELLYPARAAKAKK